MGYTAAAVLEDPRVNSLVVVEFLDAVVDWHAADYLPLDPPLSVDPRCRIVQGDFFAMSDDRHRPFPRLALGRAQRRLLQRAWPD